MKANQIIATAESPKWVEEAAETIQPIVISVFKSAGKTGKKVKDFLHGTWLGHPLHPILTDVTIGAYTSTAVMDILELTGNDDFKNGADASLAVGLVGAAGAAMTGVTDWTGTTGQNRRIGLMHATLNIGATVLNLVSLILRKKQASRKPAIGFSLAAYGITALAAYLGGHLVYEQQMGVDHTTGLGIYPLDFTDVYDDESLEEGKMICVKAGDIPVLLSRNQDKIYAITNTCSHMGGPLNEGELLEGDCVKCPWHGSVFALKDGSVVSGPATQPQPVFETRIKNGKIQVRLATSETIKALDSLDQIS